MEAIDLGVDSRMGAIMEVMPGARRAIFARYHLGGCQSCAFAPDETLAELCERSGLDAGEVLEQLLASHAHDEALWIGPAEVAREREVWRLVDLRTREEHEAVVIPGSEFFTQDLQQALFAGGQETKIVLYDHEGKNVLDQVAWFRGHGLKQTFALRGGIDGWSREVDASVVRYRLEVEED